MVSKALLSIFATVLILQTVYGNCYNNYVPQGPVYLGSGGCGLGAGLSGLSLGSNLYNNDVFVSSLNYGVESGPLSVVSGSYITPNGLYVSSENELLGQVGIAGYTPFASAVSVEGTLPSGGHGSVVYSSAPGVGLISAGCGQGLPGLSGYGLYDGVLNNGLSGYGLYDGVLNNGLSGYGLYDGVLNNGLAGYAGNNLYGANFINGGYSSIGGCGYY